MSDDVSAAPDEDSVPRRIWDQWTRTADGFVEAHDKFGHKHVLNTLAAEVWLRTDGRVPVRAIVDALEPRTGVDRATLLRAVLDVCRRLAQLDMLAFDECALWAPPTSDRR